MKNTASLLQTYLVENQLDKSWKNQNLLFTNNQHHKLTKEGIAYIITKYVKSADKISNIMPSKVTVHMLRHSKAMHLLQAGVNLIYIRDFLGHVDLKTTEIYVYPDLIDSTLPNWSKDQALLSWLSELK